MFVNKLSSHLTTLQHESLLKEVSEQEIRQEVFQTRAWKSPGPDGIPAGFYQTYWETMRTTLTDSINNFFNKGVINQEWNRSSFVFIPKVPMPTKPLDFCPISLCNVKYKIIVKIMSWNIRMVSWWDDILARMYY